jgi:hypothetical protein
MPAKHIKDIKTDNVDVSKKREGERKFDFLQRKGDVRKDIKVEKQEENTDKIEKRDFPKEAPKDERKE